MGCRLEEYFGRMLEAFSALRDDEDGIEVYHRSGTDIEPFYRGDSRTIRYSVQIPPCEAAFALMDSLYLAGGRQKRAAAYAAFLEDADVFLAILKFFIQGFTFTAVFLFTVWRFPSYPF